MQVDGGGKARVYDVLALVRLEDVREAAAREGLGPRLLQSRHDFVLSFCLRDLLREFLNDLFSLGLLLFILLVLVVFVVAFLLAIAILRFFMGLFLQLLLFLSILLLLILQLLRIQDDWATSFEIVNEGPAQDILVKEFELLALRERKHYILRFEVCMDDPAHPVHIIETQQELPRYASHIRQRDAPVFVFLYHGEEVLAKNFKCHYIMLSVIAIMEK